MERPKSLSTEEIEKLQKSRTLSDAEFLKDGALYKVTKEGAVELHLDEDHKNEAYEEMITALLKEKDPERFESAYKKFVDDYHEHVDIFAGHILGRPIVHSHKGGYVDKNGQIIAGKETKDEIRHEMYEEMMNSKGKGSKEYAEATEYFRNKNNKNYETEDVTQPNGEVIQMATEKQVEKVRREMYAERMNSMPETESLLSMPILIRPGVLESFKNVTPNGSLEYVSYGDDINNYVLQELTTGQIESNENFIGQGSYYYNPVYNDGHFDSGDGGLTRAIIIGLRGGKKIWWYPTSQIMDQMKKDSQMNDEEVFDKNPDITSGGENSKLTFDAIRHLLTEGFLAIADKQGFSKDQAELMLQVK